jgi:hypothetical protein
MAEYAFHTLPETYPEPVTPEAPVLRVLTPTSVLEEPIEYVKPVPRNPLQTHRVIGRWVFGTLGVTGAAFTSIAAMNWAAGETMVPNAWEIAVTTETAAVAGMIASRLARNWREYGRLFR